MRVLRTTVWAQNATRQGTCSINQSTFFLASTSSHMVCCTGHSGTAARAGEERSSKREHCRVLPCSKHVHQRLTHEKSNRDTDCNRDHSTSDIDPVPGCCDRAPSSLRQTRLEMPPQKNEMSAVSSRFGTHDQEGAKYTRTGTKKSTPVTMTVNAVPPNIREYIFPSSPTANAPMAETTSDLLKMK